MIFLYILVFHIFLLILFLCTCIDILRIEKYGVEQQAILWKNAYDKLCKKHQKFLQSQTDFCWILQEEVDGKNKSEVKCSHYLSVGSSECPGLKDYYCIHEVSHDGNHYWKDWNGNIRPFPLDMSQEIKI